MKPPSASDAARWSESQWPTASFATALSSRDNARAPERQWRTATDAGPDVTAAAPDWREQRTTLPPAPTDKPLAPTVDQFWGPATNPSPASGVHVVSYASFSTG